MKTFNIFNRGNPPGIETVVELDFWDIVKLMFGRELAPVAIRQSDFMKVRHGRAYDAFNLDAGFDSGPLRRL